VPKLLKTCVITGGMIPKIKACVRAIRAGVKEVWIADGVAGLAKLNGTVIK
jgi:acetylglutamate kinase